MSEAMQVVRTLYRRAHGRDAGHEEALIWAAEQLALLLEGVEMEAEGPVETPAVAPGSLNAGQIAQLNDDAKR